MEKEFEKEFDEVMEEPLTCIKCDFCDENIFCKKIYFKDDKKSSNKWMCKECFVRMKQSMYDLKIAIEKMIELYELQKTKKTNKKSFITKLVDFGRKLVGTKKDK